MIAKWSSSSWELDVSKAPHEAEFLKLDISKAKSRLNWNPIWELDQTLDRIINWHDVWLDKKDMQVVSIAEINEYTRGMNENR